MSEENKPVTLSHALGHLAVSLSGWILTGGAIYAIVRIAAQPDYGRTLVMRASRAGEHFCQQQAEGWARAADRFASTYEKARAVV